MGVELFWTFLPLGLGYDFYTNGQTYSFWNNRAWWVENVHCDVSWRCWAHCQQPWAVWVQVSHTACCAVWGCGRSSLNHTDIETWRCTNEPWVSESFQSQKHKPLGIYHLVWSQSKYQHVNRWEWVHILNRAIKAQLGVEVNVTNFGRNLNWNLWIFWDVRKWDIHGVSDILGSHSEVRLGNWVDCDWHG